MSRWRANPHPTNKTKTTEPRMHRTRQRHADIYRGLRLRGYLDWSGRLVLQFEREIGFQLDHAEPVASANAGSASLFQRGVTSPAWLRSALQNMIRFNLQTRIKLWQLLLMIAALGVGLALLPQHVGFPIMLLIEGTLLIALLLLIVVSLLRRTEKK